MDKTLFTFQAALSALNDPHLRGDMVAAVGETLGSHRLETLRVLHLVASLGD